jgi:hypothetical protein
MAYGAEIDDGGRQRLETPRMCSMQDLELQDYFQSRRARQNAGRKLYCDKVVDYSLVVDMEESGIRFSANTCLHFYRQCKCT